MFDLYNGLGMAPLVGKIYRVHLTQVRFIFLQYMVKLVSFLIKMHVSLHVAFLLISMEEVKTQIVSQNHVKIMNNKMKSYVLKRG